MIWLILGFVIVVLVLWTVSIYNRLVTYKNRYLNAFSQIEVQLKRRHDLIPSLVETAKGYMNHERETLEAVIEARNQAATQLQQAASNPADGSSIQALSGAERALSGSMGRLFAVMEAYPDLKANQSMLQLSEELTSTENRVAFSRQAFNDGVTTYNTYKQTFPPVIFAAAFGHAADASFLDFQSEAIEKVPQVNFS